MVCCSGASRSGAASRRRPHPPEEPREPLAEPAPPSPEQERDAFAKAVRAALSGERVELGSLPAILRAPSQPIYVSVRIDGESHAASWREPEDALGPMNRSAAEV